jgi:dsRNA-specific ribonuclease
MPTNPEQIVMLLRSLQQLLSPAPVTNPKQDALDNIIRFFCLENSHQLWKLVMFNKEQRDKLAFVGDAALRFYVAKELLAQGVMTSSQLHDKTQTIITNESLAKLAAHLQLHTAMDTAPPTSKVSGTFMEALLGAGEVHLSGYNTQAVVLRIMDVIEQCAVA